jgi:protein-tyrosine-phosphatase
MEPSMKKGRILDMRSVLIVCTANICRSPMAMAQLREKVSQEGGENWCIESAGVWAFDGQPAAQNTQKVLELRGIDLSEHRSRQITGHMLNDFNLILTMEVGHKEALRAAFPESASKIFMLSEMVGEFSDIADPVGGSLSNFEDTYRDIDEILTTGFSKIRDLSLGTAE